MTQTTSVLPRRSTVPSTSTSRAFDVDKSDSRGRPAGLSRSIHRSPVSIHRSWQMKRRRINLPGRRINLKSRRINLPGRRINLKSRRINQSSRRINPIDRRINDRDPRINPSRPPLEAYSTPTSPESARSEQESRPNRGRRGCSSDDPDALFSTPLLVALASLRRSRFVPVAQTTKPLEPRTAALGFANFVYGVTFEFEKNALDSLEA